ncbi:MAG: biopolymer transporter ExbD [Lentimicrobiaceae bacterium]|nr:biopolymer transporter ExbD [Lentimicrobiaceae bacterium]
MKIKPRNKSSVEFNLSTQADLVFLLLIFFMITSTMVSPNAIKLLLPNSSSKTATKRNFEVYIDENKEYSILQGKDHMAVDSAELSQMIGERLMLEENDAAVVLRADKSVPIQNVVYVIDAVKEVNESQNTQHKVILATAPNPQK